MVDENWQCPDCGRLNRATAKLCTKCGFFKGDKVIPRENPEFKLHVLISQEEQTPSLSISRDGVENELLRGKLSGIFNKKPIVLTNKRLIIDDREIDLNDILEVYSQCGSDLLITSAWMVVRLKDGEEIEVDMVSEKSPSVGTALFGDSEGALLDTQKATYDRWVNLINRLLK